MSRPIPIVDKVPSLHWPEDIPQCFNCGAELQHVMPDLDDIGQYIDALQITFTGGYGMYFDDFDDQGTRTVFLCNACADHACSLLPWFKDLASEELFE